MKLLVSKVDAKQHEDVVSCVGWVNNTELFSISDDQKILKWSNTTEEIIKVTQLPKETYVTKMHWCPQQTRTRKASMAEVCALATSNGRFILMSSSGKVEKTVEGHTGAVLAIRWSHDGTAIATAGEDGNVKIWSRTGMMRSSLSQLGASVYSVAWSPESNQVLHVNGRHLIIKPLQPSVKPTQWKAHDGLIVVVDWSPRNNYIISGGEDKKYKVWDSFGRNLYSSQTQESPVASLAWSPDGGLFAVGMFDSIRLCDKTGWSYSMEKEPLLGTVLDLSWTSDGTQVAAACGAGSVLFADLVDRKLEWANLEVIINGNCTVDVFNIASGSKEHLEFNDKIVTASLTWNHLVIITAAQMYIFNCQSWSTPVTIDLRNTSVYLIKQTERYFLLADSSSGIQVYSYEGRVVCSLKHSSISADSLNAQLVSISNDVLVIRDQKEERVIRLFSTTSGKEMGDNHPFKHSHEIVDVALSQKGSLSERQLAFIDKNNDLYLAPMKPAHSGWRIVHLGSMVSTLCWNDKANMLAGMQDGTFTVWYHPAVVYTDQDLLPKTTLQKSGSEFMKNPLIVSYTNNLCTLRRSDGAVISTCVSPFPVLLHNYKSGSLESGLRLCRFVKDPAMWAVLSGMAAEARDLNIAEAAYAAINEIHKVEHLQQIKGLSSSERRNAELALFCKKPEQAEAIYLQSNMIYRAIQLNMCLHNWERALELAVKHKTHVDTVLACRSRHLQSISCDETLKRFKQYSSQISIDWEKVEAKMKAEEQRE